MGGGASSDKGSEDEAEEEDDDEKEAPVGKEALIQVGAQIVFSTKGVELSGTGNHYHSLFCTPNVHDPQSFGHVAAWLSHADITEHLRAFLRVRSTLETLSTLPKHDHTFRTPTTTPNAHHTIKSY